VEEGVAGMTRRGESKRNPVMLSAAKHLEAHPDRPFAAAQGDTVRQLRLMRIRADKSAPTAGSYTWATTRQIRFIDKLYFFLYL